MTPVRVLIVEDSPSDAALLQKQLEHPTGEFTVDLAATFEEGQSRLSATDCVLIDLTLPDSLGFSVLNGVTHAAPETPVIVLTGSDGETEGIEAVRLGAQDYLVKDDTTATELSRTIRNAIQRKQIEAKLASVSAQLTERTQQLALSNHTVFDESLTGMIQLDATGRVLVANRAFAALTGVMGRKLKNRPIDALFGPMQTDAVLTAVADVLELGEPRHLDALLVRADGSTRLTTVQLSRLATDDVGNPVVLLEAHDITAGSSAMLRQVHAQKLDELGRLAAGMAHEIRSPLQYLTTSIDFARSAVRELLDDTPDEGSDELRLDLDEALVEIAEGVARIDQIVKGMNILSSRTGNVVDHNDVRDSLRFPLAVARGQAPADTSFVVELGDVPLVRCGLGLIQQVVLNLLVNSVHAIEDRPGAPTPPPGIVNVATSYDDKWVRISVTDNGVGMTPAVRAQAMQPFFTTKAEGRGTGQGLALVHDVMTQHDGQVIIESTVGEGTNITVLLPRSPQDPEGDNPTTAEALKRSSPFGLGR